MITQKVFDLILARVDFDNDDLEALVEDTITKASATTEAALKMEAVVESEFPDDAESQDKALAVAEGVVDFASEIGSAFPNLTAEQGGRFKALFATVFESQSDAVETAGEELFNKSVDTLQSIKALFATVAALAFFSRNRNPKT